MQLHDVRSISLRPILSSVALVAATLVSEVRGQQSPPASIPCTPEWLSNFGPANGVTGAVFACAVFDDGTGPALYVGGFFGAAGATAASSIAKWDGAQWSALGAGLHESTSLGTVYSLAVHDDGGGPALYVGGEFTSAGGVAANNIARWDGATWSALGGGAGSGVFPSVFALASYDDGGGAALYAGGRFTLAGAAPASGIAKWDGAAWSTPMIGVSSGGQSGSVYALTAFDDGTGNALYVGGFFVNAGSVPASSIAKWDGAHWSPLGSGVEDWRATHSAIGSVYALTVFDDGGGPALHAGGTFLKAGGVIAGNVAKWSGSSWFGVGSGLQAASGPSNVSALFVCDDGSGADLYAGGSFSKAGTVNVPGVARWDGSSWSTLGSGVGSAARAFAAFDDGSGPALFVGGQFSTAGGFAAHGIAKWACPITAAGTSFCLGGTTTNGCVPSISGVGVASSSSGSGFTVSVANVEGRRSGLLLYGITGGQVLPFGGGSTSFACVKAPLQILGVQNSGGTLGACDGALSADWNAFVANHGGALGVPFVGGETIWMQGWFRDPLAPTGSNLSNGLVFNVMP